MLHQQKIDSESRFGQLELLQQQVSLLAKTQATPPVASFTPSPPISSNPLPKYSTTSTLHQAMASGAALLQANLDRQHSYGVGGFSADQLGLNLPGLSQPASPFNPLNPLQEWALLSQENK